jgi:hypothetical protein
MRSAFKAPTIGALLACGLAGCVAAAPIAPATGKLTGACRVVVLPGPAGAKPEPPNPVPGVLIRILDAVTGERVAEQTTGADGRFEATLKPGRYRVAPEDAQVGGESPGPREVEVTAGAATEVEFLYHVALPGAPK